MPKPKRTHNKPAKAVVIIDDLEVECQNRSPGDVHLSGRHYVQLHVGLLHSKKGSKPLDPDGPRETIVIQFPQEVMRLDLNRVAQIIKERRSGEK